MPDPPTSSSFLSRIGGKFALQQEPNVAARGRALLAQRVQFGFEWERGAKHRGYPKMSTVDNGSEFDSNALDAWAHAHDVKLDFIRPGKPVDNAVIERVNGRFRDKCLNAGVCLPARCATED